MDRKFSFAVALMSIWLIFSTLLTLASYGLYIAAIFKGKAKPHRTTRFIVLLLAALTAAALIAKGSTTAIWFAGAVTLGSLVIFLLSLKFGMGGWAKSDLVCLFLALAGILLWKTTADPLYGLFASIGADFIGEIPMLIKTYRHPESEIWSFYGIDVVAALLNLLALRQWTAAEFAYPLYIVAIDSLIVILILRAKIKL